MNATFKPSDNNIGASASLLLRKHPELLLTSHRLDDQSFSIAEAREHYRHHHNTKSSPQTKRYQRVVSGGIGAFITATIMMPLDVVKTRLQRDDASGKERKLKSGTIPALRQLVRKEGIRCLWRGFSPTAMQLIPSSAFYYAAYDDILAFMKRAGATSYTAAPIAGMIICKYV